MPDERSTSSQAGGDDYFYVSNEAETAAPLPWYRSPWVLGGLVVALIAVGAFALLARNGDDSEEASATTVASLSPSTSTATSEPAPTTAATSTTEPPATSAPPPAIATTPPATVDTDEVATTATTAPTTAAPATTAPPDGTQPIETTPPATVATTPPTSEAPATTAAPAAISYAGTGAQAIELSPGSPESIDRFAMRITYAGADGFTISTTDANGDPATVIDVTGPYSGDRAFGFGVVDIETIDVAATGDWTIELIPVADLPLLGADVGTTFEGQGDQLVRFAPGQAIALGFACDDCAGPIVVDAHASISSVTVLEGTGTGSSFLSNLDIAADAEVVAVETVAGDVPGTWRLTVGG